MSRGMIVVSAKMKKRSHNLPTVLQVQFITAKKKLRTLQPVATLLTPCLQLFVTGCNLFIIFYSKETSNFRSDQHFRTILYDPCFLMHVFCSPFKYEATFMYCNVLYLYVYSVFSFFFIQIQYETKQGSIGYTYTEDLQLC